MIEPVRVFLTTVFVSSVSVSDSLSESSSFSSSGSSLSVESISVEPSRIELINLLYTFIAFCFSSITLTIREAVTVSLLLSVAVIVVEPEDTPVTLPCSSTFAIDGSLDLSFRTLS